MRIVTLEPFLTDTVASLGLESYLVGCSHLCVVPAGAAKPVIVTTTNVSKGETMLSPEEARIVEGLSQYAVSCDALYSVKPDLILTQCRDSNVSLFTKGAEESLERILGRRVRVYCADVRTLQGMYDTLEEVGKAAGRAREGRELANRIKAQLLDWADNFYERMKSKRVTVISSLTPLTVAGLWIPSVIELASAEPQHIIAGDPDNKTSWSEIGQFRPDVVVVAPRGTSIDDSVRSLKVVEAIPEWRNLPAVKRGEVVFCDGKRLYAPGPKFIQGAGILFSAIAGLESGYITKRDDFYRLRFLELHRHRFL